jgi:preprotein translocase SecE subunit
MTTPTTSQRKKASYFREVQNELKKVTWTSRAELILSTRAVVIATFVFGFAIYLADLAIRGVLDGFAGLARLIG